MAAVSDNFALQYSLDQAASVRRFLRERDSREMARRVWDSLASVMLDYPRLLQEAKRATVDGLMGGPSDEPFIPVRQVEDARNALRKAFSEAGAALEAVTAAAREQPAAAEYVGRLQAALEEVRRLEEETFQHWVSFVEPLPEEPGEPLSVEESLAEVLGISVGQARQKLEERKRQLGWSRE